VAADESGKKKQIPNKQATIMVERHYLTPENDRWLFHLKFDWTGIQFLNGYSVSN